VLFIGANVYPCGVTRGHPPEGVGQDKVQSDESDSGFTRHQDNEDSPVISTMDGHPVPSMKQKVVNR
jgi:hypothetical protein